MSSEKTPLLQVEHLKQYFGKGAKRQIKAVDDVSFHVNQGEVYGLVGESGSGKTTIGRDIIRIYQPTSGSIKFRGQEIGGKLNRDKKALVTSNIQMIFQDPMSSLNPSKSVFDIIAQGLEIHHLYRSKEEKQEKVYAMMEQVGLARDFARRYPNQFSGGQRQRIAIARALVMQPDFIIADEPISALDVSIQSQIVNMLKQLQRKLGITILFIAHDLAMVKYISDRIGVMHLGHIVETGTTEEIFGHPVHPYTQSLLSAQPRADPKSAERIRRIEYSCEKAGIDYLAGSWQYLGGEHYVLATGWELERWTTNGL